MGKNFLLYINIDCILTSKRLGIERVEKIL